MNTQITEILTTRVAELERSCDKFSMQIEYLQHTIYHLLKNTLGEDAESIRLHHNMMCFGKPIKTHHMIDTDDDDSDRQDADNDTDAPDGYNDSDIESYNSDNQDILDIPDIQDMPDIQERPERPNNYNDVDSD